MPKSNKKAGGRMPLIVSVIAVFLVAVVATVVIALLIVNNRTETVSVGSDGPFSWTVTKQKGILTFSLDCTDYARQGQWRIYPAGIDGIDAETVSTDSETAYTVRLTANQADVKRDLMFSYNSSGENVFCLYVSLHSDSRLRLSADDVHGEMIESAEKDGENGAMRYTYYIRGTSAYITVADKADPLSVIGIEQDADAGLSVVLSEISQSGSKFAVSTVSSFLDDEGVIQNRLVISASEVIRLTDAYSGFALELTVTADDTGDISDISCAFVPIEQQTDASLPCRLPGHAEIIARETGVFTDTEGNGHTYVRLSFSLDGMRYKLDLISDITPDMACASVNTDGSTRTVMPDASVMYDYEGEEYEFFGQAKDGKVYRFNGHTSDDKDPYELWQSILP